MFIKNELSDNRKRGRYRRIKETATVERKGLSDERRHEGKD
jgi:hypothetical protein